MKTFTPSFTSSFVAGNVFWLLVWGAIPTSWYPALMKYRRQFFLATEAANYALHGITNPLSVAFALGGTLVNSLMFFGWLPLRLRAIRRYSALEKLSDIRKPIINV